MRPRAQRPWWLRPLGAVVVAGVLVSCSGSDAKPLSRAAFTRRAEASCAELKAAGADLAKAQDPNSTGDKVKKYVAGAVSRLRGFTDTFDQLEPPAAFGKDADALVDVLHRYADGLESLGEQVKGSQTFQNVLDANADQVSKLNTLAARATVTVSRLGLNGCVLTG